MSYLHHHVYIRAASQQRALSFCKRLLGRSAHIELARNETAVRIYMRKQQPARHLSGYETALQAADPHERRQVRLALSKLPHGESHLSFMLAVTAPGILCRLP